MKNSNILVFLRNSRTEEELMHDFQKKKDYYMGYDYI